MQDRLIFGWLLFPTDNTYPPNVVQGDYVLTHWVATITFHIAPPAAYDGATL